MKKIYTLLIIVFCFGTKLLAQSPSWIENATSQTGLDSAKGGTVYVADVNQDNYPDIILIEPTSISKAHISLWLNVQRPGSTDKKDRIFVDTTKWSGIDLKRNGEHGRIADLAAFADVDNDGDLDCITCIYYHRWEYYHPDSLDPGDRCEVMLNKGWGQFELKTNSGLQNLGNIDATGLTNATGLAYLDYDKDGKIDLFISQWFKDYANNILMPSYLLKGNGDGSFTDVSASTGIKGNWFPLYGINATDWNNDGWVDLATCPYCRSSGSLWKNNGNGTFTDVASTAGYNTQFYNGEGWGDETQTFPKALCAWAAQPADYDNDGDIDFFYVLVHGGFGVDVYGKNPAGRSSLIINNGPDSNYKLTWALDQTERKLPRSYHLGDYDASWFDLDNDMWQDLVMGNGSYTTNTRLYLIRQDATHYLGDISTLLDITATNKRYPEIYSLEVFDYDLDGDDDMIFVNGDGTTSPKHKVQVIKNKIGQDKKWIGIMLKAPENCNRSSVGARIYVYSGGVTQLREIKAGFGHFGGQQPFITNFGLANNTKVDSVIVKWPTNPTKVTKVVNPAINQINIIDDKGFWGTLDINDAGIPQELQFGIYPNPASTEINLIFPPGSGTSGRYEIFDMSGKLVMESNIYISESSIHNISIELLEKGCYYIRITNNDKLVKTQPFIIVK